MSIVVPGGPMCEVRNSDNNQALMDRVFQLELKVSVLEQAMLILMDLKPVWYKPPVWNGVKKPE